MSVDELAIRRAAKSLAGWALCDSFILIDPKELHRTLELDAKTAGYMLSEAQCEEFICGDDERGVAKLAKDFPATHEYLESIW